MLAGNDERLRPAGKCLDRMSYWARRTCAPRGCPRRLGSAEGEEAGEWSLAALSPTHKQEAAATLPGNYLVIYLSSQAEVPGEAGGWVLHAGMGWEAAGRGEERRGGERATTVCCDRMDENARCGLCEIAAKCAGLAAEWRSWPTARLPRPPFLPLLGPPSFPVSLDRAVCVHDCDCT